MEFQVHFSFCKIERDIWYSVIHSVWSINSIENSSTAEGYSSPACCLVETTGVEEWIGPGHKTQLQLLKWARSTACLSLSLSTHRLRYLLTLALPYLLLANLQGPTQIATPLSFWIDSTPFPWSLQSILFVPPNGSVNCFLPLYICDLLEDKDSALLILDLLQERGCIFIKMWVAMC